MAQLNHVVNDADAKLGPHSELMNAKFSLTTPVSAPLASSTLRRSDHSVTDSKLWVLNFSD